MLKSRDVRDLREQMGQKPDGGTQKPLTPLQLKNRIQVENEADFGPRWAGTYPDLLFVRQYLFLPDRDFRFDFCWPNEGPTVEPRTATGGVALELQGGIWKDKTGHNTGAGLIRDFEKLNLAQASGWVVFQFADEHANKRIWLKRLAACIQERCAWYRGEQ